MTETYPEAGARFFLDLIDPTPTDADARYAAIIYTPGARYDLLVRLSGPAGLCTLEDGPRQPAEAPEPPAWARAHLLALARQIFRNKKDGPWQRRLMRWRPEP